MPEKGSILKFNNFHKQLPLPFVMYADFEAITKKYMAVDHQIMINRIQNHINPMKTAATVIKSFVVMIINIVSKYRFIEVKSRI